MWPLLLISLLVLCYFIPWKSLKETFYVSYRAYNNLYELDGLEAYPIIGSAWDFKWDSREFSDQLLFYIQKFCYSGRGNGLVKIWVGPIPVIAVCDPDSVKSSEYGKLADWIGTGLLISTNEKWFARRRMLTPAFHFSVLKEYFDIFVKQGEVLVDQLSKYADTDREVDIYPFTKRCTLDIVCEAAMGVRIDAQTGGNTHYVKAVHRMSEMLWNYVRFPWFRMDVLWYLSGQGLEFDRLVTLTNDFTRKIIAERRKTMKEEGIVGERGINIDEDWKSKTKRKAAFLDLMLINQHLHQVTDEDIREEVDTIMFEGHDTTATTMVATLWFIGQYPEYQEKVVEELREVFGEEKRSPTEGDIKRLVYLERCIKETLRLCPPVPLFGRRLTHDLSLKGFTFPEGMTMFLFPLATHRHPSHFERPHEFYPDHFTEEAVSKRHPYAYYPFSAGPRNCIGIKFGMNEEKVVLAQVLREYRVESVEPYPGNIFVPEIVLKPHDGVRVRLYKR